ncbi:hypothetical protein WJX73_007490 [Symbiochloris irregularis]|uniref:Uncharacterized protein n=1 Tax=Symbiochloris irregularis TaxID=706552 RepID=A0AAW1NPK2_9CHLO
MLLPVSEHTWRTAAQTLYLRGCLPAVHALPRSAQASLGQQLGIERAFASNRQALRQWPALLYQQPRVNSAATKAVADLASEPVAAPTPASRFEALGLDDRVAALLSHIGVDRPTQVQTSAIPLILAGQNVAIQSHTGSGKTLAFMLPVLSLAIQRAEREYQAALQQGSKQTAGTLQAVIVAPSRELAMQIVRVGHSLLPQEARGCIQQCIGGANPHRQEEAMKLNKPLMVVGTPGRLGELSRYGVLQTHNCGMLVLDEADQLLAPQFAGDVSRLAAHCGKKLEQGRQTVVVSATLNPKVLVQTEAWCPNPQTVTLDQARVLSHHEAGPLREPSPEWGWGSIMHGRGDRLAPASTQGSAGGIGQEDMAPSLPPQLQHWWVGVTRQHRTDAARRAIHALDAQRVLIFMNFQSRLKDAAAKLKANGMVVECLSGQLSKQDRTNLLARFRKGDFRALIVSDVMARGLDIPECDAVFNLELPSDAAHYAHRAGRTGRLGRPGTVVSFAEPHEV